MQDCSCGARLQLDIRESGRGYYLASCCCECHPDQWHRESSDYDSFDEALGELVAAV